MCLGLPAVIVSIAENQKPACEALADSGLIHYAGHLSKVDAGQLAEALVRATRDAGVLAELSTRNRALVDGLGAGRIAEALIPTAIEGIRLRPAVEEDANTFQEHAARTGSGQLVIEAADVPLAWMRFEHGKEEIGIEWILDPITRGRSSEATFVARAMSMIRAVAPDGPAFTRRIASASGQGERYSIAVLSDTSSWMNEHIPQLLLHWLDAGHRVLWVHDKAQLKPGDFCFLLGCGQIVPQSMLARYRNSLVVHESDLPNGKGWSPLTWQILEGKNRIPVTLLEAAEKVDSGAIYAQDWLTFDGSELIGEMREAVARAALGLCIRFVESYPRILKQARKQDGVESFLPRRAPADSRLDAARNLETQFDLLRVVDNERYPAFFDIRDCRYLLHIRKAE
jgi:methionyl-tRNA formyltransferase